jgi:hypothetical protein
VVRPIETEGRYEIIAGERRWRASQQAGLDEIPVVIRDVPDQTAMVWHISNNYRNFIQAGLLRCAPAAFTCYDFISSFSFYGANHYGLYNTLGCYGISQLLQQLWIEVSSWLVATTLNNVHRQMINAVSSVAAAVYILLRYLCSTE